jgi:hypothetical protein
MMELKWSFVLRKDDVLVRSLEEPEETRADA